MSASPRAGPLPRSVHIGYALGSVTLGAFGTVPGLLLLPYLTDSLGVAAGLAGLVVLIPKLIDVLLSPVAGRISDRTVTRIGPRRPFVLGGGFASGIAFMLIFAGVFRTSPAAPAWVFVMFLFSGTAYLFYTVAYLAMPAEMTDDDRDRSKLLSLRVVVDAVAILICGAVAPLIAYGHADPIVGFRLMGIAIGSLFFVGAVIAFVGTAKAPIGRVEEKEPTILAQLRVAVANRPFMVLLACFIVQGAGVATLLASVSYFSGEIMRSQIAPTFLFVAFVGPAIVCMPLWRWVGERTDVKRGFVIVSLTFALGGFLITTAALLDAAHAFVYAAVAICGCGYAGQQVFTLAMLGNCIAVSTHRTGRAQGGVFSGMFGAATMLGSAVGPSIFGLFLEVSGYVSSTAGQTVVQPGSAAIGIALGAGVAPAVLMLLGSLLVKWYRYENAGVVEEERDEDVRRDGTTDGDEDEERDGAVLL
ncbi:MFS transporter [Brevibacterium litoralis]|uniref:MFS transporter n=1 Tax=Brevibacterium litoralis TaxID=3138935 RepID=UPI0032EAA26B